MRAIMLRLAARRPCGYGTVDLYLRAMARILSELNCASSAVRCKKSIVLRSAFDLPGIAPIEPPSDAASNASSSPADPLSCRKKDSSALIRPSTFSDGLQRNCSGCENVMPVGVFAAKACGLSSPIATPTLGSAPAQQLSK